jgi:hypothetical protein
MSANALCRTSGASSLHASGSAATRRDAATSGSAPARRASHRPAIRSSAAMYVSGS